MHESKTHHSAPIAGRSRSALPRSLRSWGHDGIRPFFNGFEKHRSQIDTTVEKMWAMTRAEAHGYPRSSLRDESELALPDPGMKLDRSPHSEVQRARGP